MINYMVSDKWIPVKGTTKLKIGDPWYFEEMEAGSTNKNLKNLTFDGNVTAAPLGAMRIFVEDFEGITTIGVTVIQAANLDVLKAYSEEKHWPSVLKKFYELGCDTARFEIETKYNYDEFHTGADGYYGDLSHYKTHYGMRLHLYFDTDLFSSKEIEERMLKLFPKSNNKELVDFVNSIELDLH